MSIKLGDIDINKLYLGDTELKKVYLGDVLIYDKTINIPDIPTGIVLEEIPNRTTEWKGIDGYCEVVPVYVTYYVHELFEVPLGGVCDPIGAGSTSVWCTIPTGNTINQGVYLYNDEEATSPFNGGGTYHYMYGNNDDYMEISNVGKVTNLDIC